MYFHVFRYYIRKAFAYPSEIFFIIFRKIFVLCLILWVWSVIVRDKEEIIRFYFPYFLLSGGIADLLSIPGQSPYSPGRVIRKAIKQGDFSNFVLMPVNLLLYLYSQVSGQNIVLMALGFVQIIVGIILVKPTLFKFVLMFMLLIIAYMLSLAFNLLEAVMAFYFTEAKGIKNALRHIYRLLSGEIIPLNLVPLKWQGVIINSPFAYMNYWPVGVLLVDQVDAFRLIGIGGLWAIAMLVVMLGLWKKGLRHYEAVGL